MEIKKFEAYNYQGPDLMRLDRKKFIEEIIDIFMDQKLFGYEVDGSEYHPNEEVLILHMSKIKNGETIDEKAIKLDLSDLGIEIGIHEWNEEEEEFDQFKPEINLDTTQTKQLKTYKKDITSFNM